MLDVFKLMLSAPSNFNFYEECASAVPELRYFLKENIGVLPRELVARCELKPTYAQYERSWPWSNRIGNTVTLGDSLSRKNVNSVRRDPATLRRYAVETAALNFGMFINVGPYQSAMGQ